MLLLIVYAVILTVGPVLAHISMSEPCPRYNAHGVNCPALPAGQSIDYEQNSPLARDAPLCKHTVPFPSPSAQWTAGQSVTVSFYGTAVHGGGHCQFSLSYDGGNTFVVVYEIFGYCLHDTADGKTPGSPVGSHTFTLPSDLPSSNNAVFAWTWVNAVGNREFYMNCADITISGTSNSYTGKQMTVANHNGYPTIEAFGGNYDMGKDVYDSAPTITVTGDGSVSNSGGGGSSNASSGNDANGVSNAADGSQDASANKDQGTSVNSSPSPPANNNQGSSVNVIQGTSTNGKQVPGVGQVTGQSSTKNIGIPMPVLDSSDNTSDDKVFIPMPVLDSSENTPGDSGSVIVISSLDIVTYGGSALQSSSENAPVESPSGNILVQSPAADTQDQLPAAASSAPSGASQATTVPIGSEVGTTANKDIDFKAVKPESGNRQCSLGEMRCGSDLSTFDTCDNSGWVSRPCAPGTTCKMSSGGGSPCV